MPKNWGTYAQWIIIVMTFIGIVFTFDHRLTAIEAQKSEEFKGYTILFTTIRDKVDSMDKRMEAGFNKIDLKQDRHIEVYHINPR